MLHLTILQNCATFCKPPGFYKCMAHCCECLHSDIRLHTLVQFQINSKLGKYYYLSYLLVYRQTESHIWVNMGSRELQTQCCSVLCLQWLDTAAWPRCTASSTLSSLSCHLFQHIIIDHGPHITNQRHLKKTNLKIDRYTSIDPII